MKTLIKLALSAAMIAPLAMAPAAIAQKKPAAGATAANIAVVDINGAAAKSNAYVNAIKSIEASYKPVLDGFEARGKALQAEMRPMQTALEAASKVPNANQATLQTQAAALQKKQQDAQRELNTLYRPVALAEAYVKEQIAEKIDAALNTAMAGRGIQIALLPDAAVRWMPAVDLTADVVAQLNATLPAVNITPPAGWVPGAKQAAAQQAAQPGQPAPRRSPNLRVVDRLA